MSGERVRQGSGVQPLPPVVLSNGAGREVRHEVQVVLKTNGTVLPELPVSRREQDSALKSVGGLLQISTLVGLLPGGFSSDLTTFYFGWIRAAIAPAILTVCFCLNPYAPMNPLRGNANGPNQTLFGELC